MPSRACTEKDFQLNEIDDVIVDSYPHLNQCLAIRNKVFVEEHGVSPDLEKDEYDASPYASGHLLLKCDGVPAGTGRWIPYKIQTAKIQRLAA